jgi:hypothetical protein
MNNNNNNKMNNLINNISNKFTLNNLIKVCVKIIIAFVFYLVYKYFLLHDLDIKDVENSIPIAMCAFFILSTIRVFSDSIIDFYYPNKKIKKIENDFFSYLSLSIINTYNLNLKQFKYRSTIDYIIELEKLKLSNYKDGMD